MTNLPLDELLKLSVSERIQLAEDLWESIAAEPNALPLADAQRAEIERRLAEHDRDPESGIPWEEVRAATPAIRVTRRLVFRPEADLEINEAAEWYEALRAGPRRRVPAHTGRLYRIHPECYAVREAEVVIIACIHGQAVHLDDPGQRILV